MTLFRFAYRTKRWERSCRKGRCLAEDGGPDSNLRVALRALPGMSLGMR